MIINFRQGIVTYPASNGVQQFLVPSGNYVSINAVNGVTDVAFAHRTANYLHTESVSVPNAWGPLPAPSTVWLYWDINTLTGVRTFDFTVLQPIIQPTMPTGVEAGQHWFDMSAKVMKVWTGSRWQEKIRVFAAEYDTGTRTFTSVSRYSTTQRFDGTQVGLDLESVNVGRIIVDNAGKPITNQQNLFFTTEDDFFINGSPINTIRLEANILTATPIENVAGYQVVKFVNFGSVQLAGYDDLQNTAIAVAVQDVQRGDVGSFVVQGIVTNPQWNWTTVGQPLWVLEGGTLVEYDPHSNDNVTYNTGKAPVGRVVDRHSIVFDQGLGGKGDKGDSALAGNNAGDAATQFELGKVKLTCAPTDPGSPYVVETNDPRLTDARLPLQHNHPASDIIPTGYGASINGDLQTTLQNLENAKVSKAGDTMTGPLTLSSNPTLPLQAVPKQYVDLFVPLSEKGALNGVATLDSTGRITASQLPQMSITDTFVVNSEADMLLANAQTGDLAVRTDIHTSFILKGANPTVVGDWQELLTSPDGVTWIDIVPAAGEQGLATAGGPVTSSGQITIALAGDMKAIEALTGTGVAHRTGANTWEVKPVDLGAGGNVVTGVTPMSHGGTGLSSVTGYIKGNGTLFSASTTIPGSDIVGTVPASASAPWSGITNTPTSLVGYGITDAYTKTETNALTWNWSAINNKPTTLAGYGITDVYSKTEITTFLAAKANNATTLAGYGITDAAPLVHTHTLDSLSNVNSAAKVSGDILQWTGTNWTPLTVTNAFIPSTLSGKTLDDTNVINVKDANFTVEDDSDTTRRFKFQANGISGGTTRVYTVPNSDGTLALTNGFGATGNWNINAASATTVSWLGVTSTPTTVAGYGITDVYTKTATASLTWNWSAITNTPTTLVGYGITDAYTKNQANALTWNWSAITSTPTTVAGYGITDVYTKAAANALNWDWSHIYNTPTTLAGYNITDAASISHNHDGVYLAPADVGVTVAGLDFTGKVPAEQLPARVSTHTYTVDNQAAMLALSAFMGDICIRTDESKTYSLVTDDPSVLSNWARFLAPMGGGGSVTSVAVQAPTAGFTITGGPIQSAGTFVFTLADDLAAIEALSNTGFVKRTADNTWTTAPSIPFVDVTGTVPITQGGTGATTAPVALQNLGAVPLDGTGANGSWGIDITGNAYTATTALNGVVTTGSYADPAWITSLSASKVVGTWGGSTNVNQLAQNVTYGNSTVLRNGSTTTTAVTQFVLDTYDVNLFDSAKYTISVLTAGGAAALLDLFVVMDGAGNVYFTQTGAGNDTSIFEAVFVPATLTVEIRVTPATATSTAYRFSGTLFVSA